MAMAKAEVAAEAPSKTTLGSTNRRGDQAETRRGAEVVVDANVAKRKP
jgi:hypothetical protein